MAQTKEETSNSGVDSVAAPSGENENFTFI